MKSALIALALPLVLTSCTALGATHRPVSKNPNDQLDWAIDQFNAGHTANAKESLESVIDSIPGPELAETRAVAHFYLGAVFWDLGETRSASRHLRRCLSLRPNYQPDWKYFAPSLRKRYEALQ